MLNADFDHIVTILDGQHHEAVRAVANKRIEPLFEDLLKENPDDLTGAGKTFLDAYQAKYGAPEVYTAYAAAAAQVLTDAIGRSDGSREDVVAKMFETNITDGIVGPMSFDENGDPKSSLISIFQAEAGGPPWKFVEAKQLG